jgi:predicted GNAT superfamily acetyltransferase
LLISIPKIYVMIEYKRVLQENELRELICLGTEIPWGFSETEATMPYHTLITIIQSGGVIFGAFLEGKIIGYSISTIALKEEYALYLYMLGVSNHHTSKGIAQQLFLKNKAFAIKNNLNSIYWSFNPLDSKAANLYLHKLNAVIRQSMVHNMYGFDDTGLPTDRFLAYLNISPEITKKPIITDHLPENIKIDHSLLDQSNKFNANKCDNVAIEFPNSLSNINMKAFISNFRILFDKYLNNYIVVDFIRLKDQKKCYYLLNKR